MSFSPDEAGAQLAAIDDVVARLKQSRVYRVAGEIEMMWGGVQFGTYAAQSLAPATAAWNWLVVDALGVALTVVMLQRVGGLRVGRSTRIVAAFAIFYAFGFLWSTGLGRFGARETAVFWHTLFLFGNCLAGLWFGVGFLVIGAGLTALILAVYLFAGPHFWPMLALVAGSGYILCGYWMRRG